MIELLLSLLLALTGVPRTVDPALVAEANQRLLEIQGDFSHAGQDCCWEVLAWNSGLPSQEASVRRAAEQWRESSTHWAILADPTLTRIGCATAWDGVTGWYVCILDRSAEPEGATRSPKPTSVGSNPTGGATTPPSSAGPLLPNTAMVYSNRSRQSWSARAGGLVARLTTQIREE